MSIPTEEAHPTSDTASEPYPTAETTADNATEVPAAEPLPEAEESAPPGLGVEVSDDVFFTWDIWHCVWEHKAKHQIKPGDIFNDHDKSWHGYWALFLLIMWDLSRSLYIM